MYIWVDHGKDIQALIDQMVERRSRIGGVRAITLGGCRPCGTHMSQFDIDLGICYHPDQPLDRR